MFQAKLDELTRLDPRYAYEAYEFVFAALAHTQRRLGAGPGPEGEGVDVTARDLLEALRELAVRDFGLLAPTVFRHWGVRRTDDFGQIVENLVSAGLMSLTEEDDRAAFHDAYDLGGITEGLRIEAPREGEER
jgi:uncharacterized repeat protein (TIGR04138 family)